jgi:hypothetical protein
MRAKIYLANTKESLGGMHVVIHFAINDEIIMLRADINNIHPNPLR